MIDMRSLVTESGRTGGWLGGEREKQGRQRKCRAVGLVCILREGTESGQRYRYLARTGGNLGLWDCGVEPSGRCGFSLTAVRLPEAVPVSEYQKA